MLTFEKNWMKFLKTQYAKFYKYLHISHFWALFLRIGWFALLLWRVVCVEKFTIFVSVRREVIRTVLYVAYSMHLMFFQKSGNNMPRIVLSSLLPRGPSFTVHLKLSKYCILSTTRLGRVSNVKNCYSFLPGLINYGFGEATSDW